MFVASALGFGCGGGERGSLVRWDVGADEFKRDFFEGVLRRRGGNCLLEELEMRGSSCLRGTCEQLWRIWFSMWEVWVWRAGGIRRGLGVSHQQVVAIAQLRLAVV